ncbi:hypothetical protein IWC96_07120 [Brevundimonas sp. BAL450]|nr:MULTISPECIES: hypothetical protein [Brevundimonas]MBG7615053.1 hypothetical protein [Brevundimonas sp. BAL450]
MTDVTARTDTNTPETGSLDPTLSPRPDLNAGATSGSSPMTARIERGLREGRSWAESRTQRAGETIRAHPVRSSLGAVGVGVVLGMLLRR